MVDASALLALADRVETLATGDIGPRDDLSRAIFEALPQNRRRVNGSVPNYCGSVDAAMTLVPAGHDWSLYADNGAAVAGCLPSDPDGCSTASVHAATPALALAAASLRALAAIPKGNHP